MSGNLQSFVMKEANRQQATPEGDIDNDKMENFYNSALSSIKKLRNIIDVSLTKNSDRKFHGNLYYSDVISKIYKSPDAPNNSVIGLIHSETISAETLVKLLSIMRSECVYVPIFLPLKDTIESWKSSCEHIGIEKKSVNNLSGQIMSSVHNPCQQCLAIYVTHCNYCSFWIKLYIHLSASKVDICRFDNTFPPELRESDTAVGFTIQLTIMAPCTHTPVDQVVESIPKDTVYSLTTSGTTGIPKTVSVPNSSIIPNIIHFIEILSLDPSDKVLFCTPLTFDPSIITLFVTLYAGASFLFLDSVSPAYIMKVITNCTVLMCTPSFLNYIPLSCRMGVLFKSKIRILALGGEMFPMEIVDDYFRNKAKHGYNENIRIFNFYGLTEQSVWSFCHEFTEEDVTESPGDFVGVPLGEPVPGTQYFVKDNQLYLGGQRRCYINSQILKFDRIFEGYIATGDSVLERNGKLYILGRINHGQIKINGKIICKVQIMRAIKKFMNVKSYVKYTNGRLHLFIFSEMDLVEQSIRQNLAQILPFHYKFNTVNVISSTVPLTRHHKIDEDKLEIKHPDLTLTRSNLETAIREFLQIRSLNEVSLCDILLYAGLDSLDVLQLAHHLSDIFPSISLSEDELLALLATCPVNELYDNLTPPSPAASLTSPPQCETVSRCHMYLCVDCSPLIFTHSNTLCYSAGSHSGYLICATLPESRLLWSTTLPGRVESSPCYSDNHIAVGCHDGGIYIISVEDGRVVFRVQTKDQVKCSPVSAKGVFYCGSHDGRCYRISNTSSSWAYTSTLIDDKPIVTSPVVSSDSIFICTLSGRVTKLGLDLALLATTKLSSPVFSQPLLHSRTLVTATVTGHVVMLSSEDLSTIIIHESELPGLIYSNVLLYKDKCLINTNKGVVFCLDLKDLSAVWKVTTNSHFSVLLSDDMLLCVNRRGVISALSLKYNRQEHSITLPGMCFSGPAVVQVVENVNYFVVGCRDNYCYVVKFNTCLGTEVGNRGRMNSEVAKCAVERENLHRDFGADSFASWRQEHSSVVLTEQEQMLVEDNEANSKKDLHRSDSLESR